VSGSCRKTMERSVARKGNGAGTEWGAGFTEIGWSAERLFCRSFSAHMLSLYCCTAPSVNTFKIRLKTFLFNSA